MYNARQGEVTGKMEDESKGNEGRKRPDGGGQSSNNDRERGGRGNGRGVVAEQCRGQREKCTKRSKEGVKVVVDQRFSPPNETTMLEPLTVRGIRIKKTCQLNPEVSQPTIKRVRRGGISVKAGPRRIKEDRGRREVPGKKRAMLKLSIFPGKNYAKSDEGSPNNITQHTHTHKHTHTHNCER